jgi:hypothetical protein
LIRFPKDSSILAATLGEKAPEDLQPAITLEAGVITIAPLLLNPGDRFRITTQLLGEFNEPTVEARISGIPFVSRQTFRQPLAKSPKITGIVGAVAMLAYFYMAGSILFPLVLKPRVIHLPLLDCLVVTLLLGMVSCLCFALTFFAPGLSVAQGKTYSIGIFLVGVPIILLGADRSLRGRASSRAFSATPSR